MGTRKFKNLRPWHSERGDVPGWVMVTVMTAGLVMMIWGLAGPQLKALFERAISIITIG